MIAVVALNLVGAVVWFFKGSAWAGRVAGVQVAQVQPAAALASGLLALNGRDVPAEISQRSDGEFEVNWRYADARWFDLMRVHQMTRIERLVLNFDAASHTVRVSEYWSRFDASAGMGDVRLEWKMNTGIQFFAFEHTRVFGAQLGSDGRPTGEWSKAYTFDLQALKDPIIKTVTLAGWRWQPVVWNAPASLRWLTE